MTPITSPYFLTLVLAPVQYPQEREQGWVIPVPTRYLARAWQAAAASVSTTRGFHKQAQSADFLNQSGLYSRSCHFQALTLVFHVPICKSR